jgi:peroxiredoxin
MKVTITQLIGASAMVLAGLAAAMVPLYADQVAATASANDRDVATSAEETHPLGIGAKIPRHLKLVDINGKHFNLNSSVAAKPTILIFYRGSWCPFCNLQMGQLEEIVPNLEAQGYQILAISPDLPENLRSSIDKHHLTYTLLSDSHMQASQAFGLAFHVDDATYARMSSFGVNLEAATGTKQRELPIPAAYVIDRSGTIRFAYSNPNFKVRVDPQALLAAATAAVSDDKRPN